MASKLKTQEVILQSPNVAILKSATDTPINGLISLTQAQYDAIETKDANTLYSIEG